MMAQMKLIVLLHHVKTKVYGIVAMANVSQHHVCDGSSEFCNAGWGPDCANGADEGLEFCGYTDDCTD
jgi:hypothetical protein